MQITSLICFVALAVIYTVAPSALPIDPVYRSVALGGASAIRGLKTTRFFLMRRSVLVTFTETDGIQCNSAGWHIGGDEFDYYCEKKCGAEGFEAN
ncbi:hypothetical protein CSPAE12_07848 [Colletotrichum incanum]|nr:hypothetical protein CSPAE12_07848 [Colletotrichum incanum]